MNEPQGARDLNRLKWATMVVPVVFVWAFEVVRFLFLDRTVTGDDAHVLSAMIMGGAIVIFATFVSIYLDRTQKQLLARNKDLTVTHAISSAVRGGLALPNLLDQALDRVMEQTGALAGTISILVNGGEPLTVRRPDALAPGLGWLAPLLDEPVDPGLDAPAFARRAQLDTGVLDLPLIRGSDRIGHLRVVIHPAVDPDISPAALADITGEIAGAAQLALTVANLHRRERERAALYEVALQLTGRADLHDVLDAISGHARELLGADRAVVCLTDTARTTTASGGQGRIAVADDGSVCLIVHRATGTIHPRNPECPLLAVDADRTWAARPLRGPDGILGELCVVRAGQPFNEAERTLLGALADMATIAVRTARLHEAEEQWTIHAERDRIARELHDSLAQVLGVIHLQLRALEGRAKDEASYAMAGELSQIADTADEAYRDVREAILGLRETVRDDTGLEGSLREYLRKYSRQTGISASLTCDGDTRASLTPRSEVQLLRVVQEALTNTRKHSQATHVQVRMECATAATTLTIEDDGIGFDLATVNGSMDGGFGLSSMRERVEQIGGTLAVHTAPKQGTRIVVHLEAESSRGSHSAASQGAARR